MGVFCFIAEGSYVVFFCLGLQYTFLMHLYFIRHGESVSNQHELITGQLDVALTDKGRAQATAAGQLAAAQGIVFDHIVSSPLMRAHDTARLIAREVGFPEEQIQLNALALERSFGSLQGQPKGDVLTMTDEYVQSVGGEVDSQVRERAQLLLDELMELEGTVLVVSHTGFGRRLRGVVQHISTEDSQVFNNAELTDLGII